MAKGRCLNDNVRLLISEVYQAHPDWPAKMIKHEVNRRLGQENWPGLSAVQKELGGIKERLITENFQERPWNTDALDKYPQYAISPETLPIVLKVWKSCIEKDRGFTVREAKWVSRLSYVITNIGELVETAMRYALVERLYNMIGQPFNSRGLDKRLMSLPFDDFDPFEPRVSDLPPFVDKDGDIIDFTSPDAKERFQAKRKGGKQNERKHKTKKQKQLANSNLYRIRPRG